jgi:hypothetical protein
LFFKLHSFPIMSSWICYCQSETYKGRNWCTRTNVVPGMGLGCSFNRVLFRCIYPPFLIRNESYILRKNCFACSVYSFTIIFKIHKYFHFLVVRRDKESVLSTRNIITLITHQQLYTWSKFNLTICLKHKLVLR